MMAAVLSVMFGLLVILTLRCEAPRCYECFHCNKILLTWTKVYCNGSCVTKQTIHKFVEPEKASTHLCDSLKRFYRYNTGRKCCFL